MPLLGFFILLYSLSDLKVISQDLLKSKDVKKFSFNFDVHTKLQSLNINHEAADDFLSLDVNAPGMPNIPDSPGTVTDSAANVVSSSFLDADLFPM